MIGDRIAVVQKQLQRSRPPATLRVGESFLNDPVAIGSSPRKPKGEQRLEIRSKGGDKKAVGVVSEHASLRSLQINPALLPGLVIIPPVSFPKPRVVCVGAAGG